MFILAARKEFFARKKAGKSFRNTPCPYLPKQYFHFPIRLSAENLSCADPSSEVPQRYPKGIFRTKKGGEEFQKILDAGTYHFARENIILLKFFVCGDAFYFVYGEDGGSIKKYVPAEEGDEPDQSLTVYSLQNNDVILDMISESHCSPDPMSQKQVRKNAAAAYKLFLPLCKRTKFPALSLLFYQQVLASNLDHSRTYLQGYSGANDLLYGNAKFMFVLVNGGSELAELPSIVKYKNGEIVGNNGVFFPSAMLGVNSMSKKKDLALIQ